MTMKISTIIPLYNNRQYLRRCVDSIYRQGLSDSDFELIIVDDGSTDGGGQLADEIATEHTNVTVIHKANGGAASARQAGQDIARGEYLHFVDADDWLFDNAYLYACREAIGKGDYDFIRMAYCNSSDLDSGSPNIKDEADYSGSINEYIRYVAPMDTIWSTLFRRDIVKDISHRQFPTGEDTAFDIAVLNKAKTVRHLPQPILVYWNSNPSSASRPKGVAYAERVLEGRIALHKMIDETIARLDPQLTSKLAEWKLKSLYYTFYIILKSANSLHERRHLFALLRQSGIFQMGMPLKGHKFVRYASFSIHHPILHYMMEKSGVLTLLLRTKHH